MDSHVETHESDNGHLSLVGFTRRVLVLVALIALLYFVWMVQQVFLLLFAGVVLATILTRLTGYLTRIPHMPRLLALWFVVLMLGGIVGGILYFIYPIMYQEAMKLAHSIPEMRSTLQQSGIGREVLEHIRRTGNELRWGSLFSQVTGVASGLFNMLTSLFLILFLTLFLAAKPDWYVNGVVDSFPHGRRKHMREVMHCAGEALWRWLIAQAVAMLLIGTLATVGMWIVGMKFAIVLGLLAGTFQFVPFVGPILWSVPATLLALAQSPMMAVKVLAVYVFIQVVEGNAITPLVQRHEAAVPPAVILLSTVALGIFFGPLGLILATPLTVVCLVFYQMLYRQAALGDDVNPMGDTEG